LVALSEELIKAGLAERHGGTGAPSTTFNSAFA